MLFSCYNYHINWSCHTWFCNRFKRNRVDLNRQLPPARHDLHSITSPGGRRPVQRRLIGFKYRHIKTATKSFSVTRKLGQGASGVVYRGVLKTGQQVAVKKLMPSTTSLQAAAAAEREFQNELAIAGSLQLQHPDCDPYVVKLLGYCADDDHNLRLHAGKRVRLLVYECMENRSLQEALFGTRAPSTKPRGAGGYGAATPDNDRHHQRRRLGWGKRFQIITDTAKALHFLHHHSPPVIHGDIKPSNILLDANFSARIADFGLARFKTDPQDLAASTVDHESSSENQYSADHESLPSLYQDCSITTEADQRPPRRARSPMIKPKPNSAYQSTDQIVATLIQDKDRMTESPNQLTDANDSTASINHNNVQTSPFGCDFVDKSVACELDDKSCTVGMDPEQDVDKINAHKMSGKAYVLDWLSSVKLHASDHQIQQLKVDVHEYTAVDEEKGPKVSRRQIRDGDLRAASREAKIIKDPHKVVKQSQRKCREWWKDEYFAELNNKSRARGGGNNTTNAAAVNDYSGIDFFSGELRKIEQRPAKDDWRSKSQEWLRGSIKRKLRFPSMSMSNDMQLWSGEPANPSYMNTTTAAHELVNQQWSGDLSVVSSTTSMRGTVCYVAPEYGGFNQIPPSEKSDIYSFGVLMLVILSGRRPIQISGSHAREFERANLIAWARRLSRSGKLLDLIDESLAGEYDKQQAYLCVKLALLCLQRVPDNRPDISEVLKILSGEVALPQDSYSIQ